MPSKTLPRSILQSFTDQINALSAHGQSVLLESLTRIDLTNPDVAKVRRQVVGVMESVCGVSTAGVGQLSASFYNACRQIELGQTIRTTSNTGRNPQATEGAVRAFAQKLVDEEYQEFASLCAGRVDYECKVAAAQTCLNNARIDPTPPKFARVPTGDETCDFCLMLASNGFVYRNEVTASHSHQNCDCRIVPSWESESVEDYDPDELRERWKAAVDELAEKRAERKGTSFEEEREHIMEGYKQASIRAKKRRKNL